MTGFYESMNDAHCIPPKEGHAMNESWNLPKGKVNFAEPNSSTGKGEIGNNILNLPTVKKQISPAKHWVFTVNNYTPADWDTIISSDSARIPTLVCQKEIGESGTPHIQGALSFSVKDRAFNTFGKDMKVHWEKAKNPAASRAYCCKEDTRKEGTLPYLRGYRMPFKYKLKLRPWQQGIVNILNEKPCDRTIHWYYDASGGIGKTSLCKHIYMNMHGVVVCGGKAADFKHGVASYTERVGDTPEIVLIDIPRSIEKYVSFDGIESVKNAFFYSSKYEGFQICGNIPHVVCFANTPPNQSKMSEDRWHIVDLGSGENEVL